MVLTHFCSSYAKMVACWETEPENRPDFASLSDYFSNLYKLHYSQIVHDVSEPASLNELEPLGKNEEPKATNLNFDVIQIAHADNPVVYTKLYDVV